MHQDPRNLDAWAHAQRGWWHYNQETREDNAQARASFLRAIEREPHWGWPHAGLALSHFKDASRGWTDTPEESIAALVQAAERAVALDDRDGAAHHALGHAYAMSEQPDKMIASFELGAELNPSDAMATKCLGAHLAIVGRSEEAIHHLNRAIAISPRDPWMFGFLLNMSWAHFAARDYGEALEWAERSIQQRPNPAAYQVVVASLAHLGRLDVAKASLDELLRLQPDLSIEGLEQFFASADPDFPRRLVSGLQQAGWKPPRRKRGPFFKM
jgi:tetratricopeptide (TPR) repeat protein